MEDDNMRELKYYKKLVREAKDGKQAKYAYIADYTPRGEEITKEEWEAHLNSVKHQPELSPREPLIKEIKALKKSLAESDYKAIKFAEGVMSAEEYAPIKAERQAARDRINELEAQLANM